MVVQPNSPQDPQFLALQQRLQALQQGETPIEASPWQAAPPPSSEIRHTVAALQRRTSAVLGTTPVNPAPATPWDDPALRPLLEGLHRQADRINGLAQDQITALQRFKQEVDGLDWHLRHRPEWAGWTVAQMISLPGVQVPWVQKGEDPGWQVRMFPVDLNQQQQEAHQTAALLRQRRRLSPHPRSPWGWAIAGTGWGQGRTPITLWGAIAWVVAGAIARRGLEVLLVPLPGLWLLVVGLLMAGAGWGLYHLLTHPPEEWAAIWCLLLTLMGVILGGYV